MSRKADPATVYAIATAMFAVVLFQNAHDIVVGGLAAAPPQIIPHSRTDFGWLLYWWPYFVLTAVGLPLALRQGSVAALLTVQLLGLGHGLFQVVREIAAASGGLAHQTTYPLSLMILLGWLFCTALIAGVAITRRYLANRPASVSSS